jgi:hypothetical protein
MRVPSHKSPGLPPANPDSELLAKHGRVRTFLERFEGTLIALGAAIGLLVILSIIGRLV